MAKVILMTPEELTVVVMEAQRPLIERLEEIEKKQLQERLFYATEEIASIVSVSPRTVRSWVQQGKTDRNGRLYILEAVEMVKGRYLFELDKVLQFVNRFR